MPSFNTDNAIVTLERQRNLGQILVEAHGQMAAALDQADLDAVAQAINSAFERTDVAYQLISTTLEAVRNLGTPDVVSVNVSGRSIQQQLSTSADARNMTPLLVASDALSDRAQRIWGQVNGTAGTPLSEEARQFLATIDFDQFVADPNFDLSTIPADARPFLAALERYRAGGVDEYDNEVEPGGAPYAGLNSAAYDFSVYASSLFFATTSSIGRASDLAGDEPGEAAGPLGQTPVTIIDYDALTPRVSAGANSTPEQIAATQDGSALAPIVPVPKGVNEEADLNRAIAPDRDHDGDGFIENWTPLQKYVDGEFETYRWMVTSVRAVKTSANG